MTEIPTYRKEIKILRTQYISCYVYFMNPSGVERPHYHDGIEMEFVLKGSCKTHKRGHFYFRPKGMVHEGINDSNTELVFLSVTIPAESEKTTHYL